MTHQVNSINATNIFKAADEIIECKQCGACCRDFSVIVIRKDEIQKLAKHFKISPSKLKRKYKMTHKATYEWQFPGNPCPFLKGKNHCTIYDLRPLTCQVFPFAKMWHAVISRNIKTIQFKTECAKSMAFHNLFADPKFAELVSLKTKFTPEQSHKLRTIMMRKKPLNKYDIIS